jgi:hypothetical protein
MNKPGAAVGSASGGYVDFSAPAALGRLMDRAVRLSADDGVVRRDCLRCRQRGGKPVCREAKAADGLARAQRWRSTAEMQTRVRS